MLKGLHCIWDSSEDLGTYMHHICVEIILKGMATLMISKKEFYELLILIQVSSKSVENGEVNWAFKEFNMANIYPPF